MPSSDDNSPSVSLDACSVATVQCVLTIAIPFILTLDPLIPAHLSEVNYLILGLYTTYSVLLYTAGRLGRPLLIFSVHGQPQSQRRVHEQLFKHSEQEVKTSKKPLACQTDTPHALSTFAHSLTPRSWHSPVCSTPGSGKWGRRGQNILPAQVSSFIEAALASRVANHQVLIARQICCPLTPNELDDTQLPYRELLAGYKCHVHAECDFRFLKDP
jgi:hypothetical protein